MGNQPFRILGAGIAGLLAGFWLKEAGVSFQILERSQRAGGILGSHSLSGGIAEQAANGFLWSPAMQQLCDGLGLNMVAPKPEAKARYLVRNGRLRRYPFTVGESLQLLGRLFRLHGAQFHTVEDFALAHLGAAGLRQAVAPGLSGIYGAKPHELSFEAVLPDLAAELERGSWLPGAIRRLQTKRQRELQNQGYHNPPSGTHGFAGGMQELISALRYHLQEHIVFGRDALLEAAPSLDAPVLSCLPAYETARWLRACSPDLPVIQAICQELDGVRYLPMISCTAHFSANSLPGYKPGFGCLIPEEEGFNFLGVLFNSSIFSGRTASPDSLSFTGILRDDEGLWASRPDADLAEALRSDLTRLMGGGGAPVAYQVYRWPQGIPLYSPALWASRKRLQTLLKEGMPGLKLFGNYTGQISIRGMAGEARREFGDL